MKLSLEIKGTKILLLGYGREGQSTHRFLINNYPGVKISITDEKDVRPVATTENIWNGADYLKHLDGFTTVIRSPGIPAHLHELKNFQKSGGWVTSATDIFFSVCPGKTIGITGTKGKSTTSALIADILATKYSDVRLAGNIGNPMLDALDGASERSIFVIELSSHQLEDARFSPHVAVILNIVPEHLDYYKNFSAYKRAKSHIVTFQNPANAVIFNPSHQTAAEISQVSKGKKYEFSLEARDGSVTWVDKNKIYSKIAEETRFIINTDEISLIGNLENILAAITVGALYGVPAEKIGEAVTTFKALPHRLELVGEFKGRIFYNDSLATIPEATMHALDALGENVETLLVGGFDRGLDYTELGVYLAHRRGLKNLVLFRDTGKRIWTAIQSASSKPPYRHSRESGNPVFSGDSGSPYQSTGQAPAGMTKINKFDVSSMEEAVQLAFKKTSPGKICLLSPASASYNLFRDYAERGDRFKEFIRKYK